ncbi:MAG TPA: DUF2933 domain-containing protein [Pseudolabrys sp.]|jgi:DUF2933 family protein|nr:DUF2933 domain-containing protein [Pseudolabrys sp.]
MFSHEYVENRGSLDRRFRSARFGLVLIGFLIIAAALLLTEHRAHVFGLFIWLPILACPLMHIFMHGGHGGHAGPGSQDQRDRSAS